MPWNSPEEEIEAMMNILKICLSSSASKKAADDSDPLLKWLDETIATLASNTDPLLPRYSIVATHEGRPAKLLALLRECLLAHRWQAASRVLMAIAKKPATREVRCSHVVLRVGLELFAKSPDEVDYKRLESFVSGLKSCMDLTEEKVSLAFFLFLVANKQFAEAEQTMVLRQGKSRCAADHESMEVRRRRPVNNNLFNAYKGLLSYIDWLVARHSEEQAQNGVPSGSTDSVQSHADSAINCFETIVKQDGVWDIFVTKYVELLIDRGKTSDAQRTLEQYTKTNCLNPNAWKYLYYFYEGQNEDALARQALKELVALVPSDELALELYRQSAGSSIDSSDAYCVQLLFDLLDYSIWAGDVRPWKYLAKELVKGFRSSDEEECARFKLELENTWALRSDWWAPYQFVVPLTEEIEANTDLVVYKAAAAQLLLGSGNNFTERVWEWVSSQCDKPRCFRLLRKAVNL